MCSAQSNMALGSYRLRMVCKTLHDGFVWKHTRQIYVNHSISKNTMVALRNALVPHLPSLTRVVALSRTLSNLFEDEPAEDEATSKIITALAPQIKITPVLCGWAKWTHTFLSHWNPNIIEDLEIWTNRVDKLTQFNASFPRLSSAWIYCSDWQAVSDWLELFSTRTGKLRKFTLRCASKEKIHNGGPAMVAAIHKLAAANPRLCDLKLDFTHFDARNMFNFRLDSFFDESESTSALLEIDPDHWPSIPERFQSFWGISPKAIRLDKQDMFQIFVEKVLFSHLRREPSFVLPDLAVLDNLSDRMCFPAPECPSFSSFINAFCQPDLRGSASRDPLLTWAENRLLERIEHEKRWKYNILDQKLLAEALTVFGYRLSVEEHPSDTRDRAANTCAELLNFAYAAYTINSLEKNYVWLPEALIKGVVDAFSSLKQRLRF